MKLKDRIEEVAALTEKAEEAHKARNEMRVASYKLIQELMIAGNIDQALKGAVAMRADLEGQRKGIEEELYLLGQLISEIAEVEVGKQKAIGGN